MRKKAQTAPAVRKRRLLLYQQFYLHSGGGHTGGIYHQCIPHHFRQTGNGPYRGPDCKADPVKRRNQRRYGRSLFLPHQPDERGGRDFLPGIRPRQHKPYPDRDTFLRLGDRALLPGRLLEVQPCAYQRPLTGGRRQ